MTDRMSELEALQARNAELEAELRSVRAAATGLSRRQVLARGAGVVGAVAGTSLLTSPRGAMAATSDAETVPTTDATTPITGYIQIRGQKQGLFKGQATPRAFADWSELLGLDYDVDRPIDPASGLPTGRLAHKPFTFIKEWGAASPQILNALVSNELLTQVTVQILKTSPKSGPATFYTFKMTNAFFSSFHDYLVDGSSTGLEQVSIVFQQLVLSDLEAKTTAIDRWAMPG